MKSATSSTSDATSRFADKKLPLWGLSWDGQQRDALSGSVFAAALQGVLGAWCGLLTLIGVFAVRSRSLLSGLWELQSGLLGLAPLWLLLSAGAGAGGGLSAWLLLSSRLAPSRRAQAARMWLFALVFVFGAVVGYGVGGGRHLPDLTTRAAFALCVGCLGAVLSYLSFPWLGRLLRSPRGRVLTATSWLLLAVAAEVLNHGVLVRLYLAFHVGLSVLTLALSGAAWVFIWGSKGSRAAQGATLGLLVLAAGAALPASRMIRGFDNFRMATLQACPSLGWGVELAARLAPPEPIDPHLALMPLGARRPRSGIDFRGHDILLISIDALRADHLGAYGYGRATSPAMDALARSGVRFDAAYAPTPHTSYSVTSLLSGKYMRPLLSQGAGQDSELWAGLLSTYGYKTAAFYPPAVFFIDTPRFESFRARRLDFEYAKVEFAEGEKRLAQLDAYLARAPRESNVFLWVHLFGPHEPYEKDPRFDWGDRDIDRYDSEIRAADETVGQLVARVRARDPQAVVLLTADHGEEFGDHGGRYHGTTVYDEQVRVPLIIAGPGVEKGLAVSQPVQTIDLLPTVLGGLDVPPAARLRGRDLRPLLGEPVGVASDQGRAVAETDTHTLLAQGKYRLVCHRRSGACQLFDIVSDPGQKRDVANEHPQVTSSMRDLARSIAASHGRFESEGLREEGKGWPPPILLAMSGNAEVAPQLSQLLDDADAKIRAKAAELLFSIASESQAPALRLALKREEHDVARNWIALTLTSLGQGAPLVVELLHGSDPNMRRWAALALAEQGDRAGLSVLLSWWQERSELEHALAVRILGALGKLGDKRAVPGLLGALEDVRLRPAIAQALALIGDKDAVPLLSAALQEERYHPARNALADALLRLGAGSSLVLPLRHFLGVPDPMPRGLEIALEAGILDEVGGPQEADRARLTQLSSSAVTVSLVVPGGKKASRVQFVALARSLSNSSAAVFVQPHLSSARPAGEGPRFRDQPQVDPARALKIELPADSEKSSDFRQVHAVLPQEFSAKPGFPLSLAVYAPEGVEIRALAVVPVRDEIPPPPPEAWEQEKRPARSDEP